MPERTSASSRNKPLLYVHRCLVGIRNGKFHRKASVNEFLVIFRIGRCPDTPRVFISWSHKDSEWKNRFVAVLRQRGIDVWEDSRLQTGEDWNEEIHQAILSARVALLLISPNYLSSATIQREQIPFLLANNKPLYPVLIEACEWQQTGWLSSVQIFPADLRPLSEVSEPDLSARLALAALEISSSAGIASVPLMTGARVTDSSARFLGMATLVDTTAALACLSQPQQGLSLNLQMFGLQPESIEAQVEFIDYELNLSLLRLNTRVPWVPPVFPLRPLPGTVWECMSVASGSVPVFTTGTVVGMARRNGGEYLHLQPSIESHEARGMSGAPIVVDGRVVAVLQSQGAILDEWFAIPIAAIAEKTIGRMILGSASQSHPSTSGASGDSPGDAPPSPPPEPPPAEALTQEVEFDTASFVDRLSPGARAALDRAVAFQVALGEKELQMEHLLLGLYGQPDSPMRKLAREAGIQNEQGLRKLLSAVDPRLTTDLNLVSGTTFSKLSEFSDHVRQAFMAAQERGGPRIGRRSLLEGALSVNCGAVAVLPEVFSVRKARSIESEPILQKNWLPEVSSDVPGQKDKDLLNIQRDVNALCSVVAAADAALPLSIGLFGDWGSGKSFFMNRMEATLDELASQGPPTYCSEIVQLKFNAWHYMDTSLWASLTSEIFEGLATKLSKSPGLKPENKAAELLADLSSSRDKLAEAERKKDKVEAELAESEARLQNLEESQSKTRARLSPRVLLTEATRLALEQDEVKEEFHKAAKELNLPQAAAEGAEVNKQLLELRGLWGAMLVAMRNTERLWVWLLALSLVVGVAFGLPRLVRDRLPSEWESTLKTLVATVTTILGSMAALLAPFIIPAKRALKYLQEARKKSEQLAFEKQKEQRAALEAEHKTRQAELEKQNATVEQARDEIRELQNAIDKLRADRQMFDFIRQRSSSTDYTSHLGIIARAHKDFRELSAFLERATKEPNTDSTLPRVERIVLYIDDLDRCPEDKVMDVLQAVHLLLAFPLFVVVVGVDPRWLLHSVAERSPALRRQDPTAKELWESTPINYLEKIFQIPFTLSPMSSTGFNQLVEKVAGSKQGDGPRPHPAPIVTTGVTTQVQSPVAATQVDPIESIAKTPPVTSADNATLAAASESPAEPLKIESWERDYMKQLYCLIPSPRAGKRFVNIYRMIRSTVDGKNWQAFVGSEKDPGHHRHVLLLLAILTGYPTEAAEILRSLIEREHNETWWEFVESFGTDGGSWAELQQKLRSLCHLIRDDEGCDTFRQYAPWVARYSFQSGRVLLAQRLPQADD